MNSLDSDLKAKNLSKYSVERETEARIWIGTCIGEELSATLSFQDLLKDGIILCKLINVLLPQRKKLVPSASKLGFKQMENIHLFLQGIQELGVRPFESFQTVDLFEGKNMVQVIDCIFAVSRCAEKAGYVGERLGPKMSTKNERKFTKEQLDEAKHIIPLMVGGMNKGASQKGMTFSAKRQIGGMYEGGFGRSKEVELDTETKLNGFEVFHTKKEEIATAESQETLLEGGEEEVVIAEKKEVALDVEDVEDSVLDSYLNSVSLEEKPSSPVLPSEEEVVA